MNTTEKAQKNESNHVLTNNKKYIMKKFELFCIKFILFVYTQYIVEDWSIYTKMGKFFTYPVWFYRACLIWLICPIFLPEYFFKQSTFYKQLKKIQESKQFQAQMAMMMTNFKMPS